jgi:hypothetical protein
LGTDAYDYDPPVGLEGLLGVTIGAKGIVLFAHGSGRLSPRNNFVAQALRDNGLATLLSDLLTFEEARDRRNVFHIELLARRLLLATAWVRQVPRRAIWPSAISAPAPARQPRLSEERRVRGRQIGNLWRLPR